MDPSSMLGPIDALEPVIEYLILGVVVLNLATRNFQHRRHQQAVAEGAEHLSRHPAHVTSNVAMVLASLYFLSVDYHGGVVMTVLVLGLVITDFFEFEARQVEARNGRALDTPKAALVISGLVFVYAFYLSLFFVIEPVWEAIFAS